MVHRKHLSTAVVDQCRDGLKDPVSGLFYRKRSLLDVNNTDFKDALEMDAQCLHAPADHQHVRGEVFLHGKWIKRSQLAAKWTPKFANRILRN